MSEERTPEELETGLPPFLDTNCIVRYLTATRRRWRRKPPWSSTAMSR